MSGPTYIVQSYYQQGRKVIADQARKVDGAKRLTGRPAWWLYSILYEPEADVTGEPRILFKAGTLPPELENV